MDKSDHLHNHSQTVISKLKKQRGSISVVISQIALGEVFNHFWPNGGGDHKSIEVGDLRYLEVDTPPVKLETIDLAKRLMNSNYKLGVADALIASTTILDRNASWLLTNDPELIDNQAIRTEVDDMISRKERNCRLNISDNFKKA